MIYQEVNRSDFHNAFNSIRPNNFSYEGLNCLYDYLDELEDVELDVIAICCDFSELSLSELLNQYDITENELTEDNEAELLGIATDYLQENTFLVGVTSLNTFVFQDF